MVKYYLQCLSKVAVIQIKLIGLLGKGQSKLNEWIWLYFQDEYFILFFEIVQFEVIRIDFIKEWIVNGIKGMDMVVT